MAYIYSRQPDLIKTHKAWIEFLQSPRWTHFVTLTSNDRSRARNSKTPEFTTSSQATGFMQRRLREWDARVNRALLGKYWYRKTSERIVGFGTLESVNSNPHWHLVIQLNCRYPKKDFATASEDVWSELVPAGSIDVRPITSMTNLSHYISKSKPYHGQCEKTAFLPYVSL